MLGARVERRQCIKYTSTVRKDKVLVHRLITHLFHFTFKFLETYLDVKEFGLLGSDTSTAIHQSYNLCLGPSIKYVTLEGVRKCVTVRDRGREGPRACDVTLLKIFILHIKPEIESDAFFSVLTDV